MNRRWPAKLAQIAAALVATTGLAVLLGWIADIDPLKSMHPAWAKMSPLTALTFVLAGVALWSTNSPAKGTASAHAVLQPRQQWFAVTCASLVVFIGALRVIDYVAGWNLGLDLLGMHEGTANTANSVRTAPATAVDFLLLGTALLLTRRSRFLAARQASTIIAALIAWLGLSHYLFGGQPLTPFLSMAAHTAMAFLILSIGVMCVRADFGLMALLTSTSAGGVVARVLVPAVLLLPLALGWLRLRLQRAGWFGTEEGVSLFALGSVVVFGSLVWLSASRLHRADRQRANADRTRRESQRLLQAIVENSPAVIHVKDLAGRYLLANRRYTEIFDLSRDAALGKTDEELFARGIAAAFHAMDQRVVDAGRALVEEQVVAQADGAHTYLSVRCPLRDEVGEIRGVFGISTDITDRKRMEDALRESEGRFRTLAESLPQLVWTCRPDGWCDYLSRQWVEYTGRPASEQLGYGWVDHVHVDDRQRARKEWAEATQHCTFFDIEFRIRRADGVYRWFKTRAVPLLDASGQIEKWFGSNTDIDDIKRAEQRLKVQLDRHDLLNRITRAIGEHQDLRSILQVVVRSLEDNLPIDFGCVCLRHDDNSLQVASVGIKSSGLATELGMDERARIPIDSNGLSQAMQGRLVYEPDLTVVQMPFPQRLARHGLGCVVMASLSAESTVFGVLVAARREAGGFSSPDCEFLRQLSEHVALATHQAQLSNALQVAYEDLRRTQQAVMQQERLSALGQMASGIAHDVNNAISPIALYTESLLDTEPDLSARARSFLQVIGRAIDDVAATVARMREFCRPREPAVSTAPVQLNSLVQHVVDLTRARWSDLPQKRGNVIEMRIELDPELPAVACVESEIREALTNLVFNAVDAMPDGGTLTIRSQVSDMHSMSRSSAGAVCLEVIDTGVGMSEDTQRRCLEPFFTTKGERGTGLGLAMVYGIVKRHGADIEIESIVGKGTTVRLSFGRSSDAIAGPASSEQPLPVLTSLRILVVDDDPLVLESLRSTLETDGHVIHAANDGQAGIDAFRTAWQQDEPFDVVITDLGMPYVDGRKVAQAVKECSPHTPVILLTGWGQRMQDDGEMPPHVNRVLGKPPKLGDLRATFAALRP